MLTLSLCGLTVLNGHRWWTVRTASLDQFEQQHRAELAALRSQLVAIESGELSPSPFDGNPMQIKFPAVLRPGPLAQLAYGESELRPAAALLSPWRNADSMFGRYEFENPDLLVYGRMDYTFLVVFVAPLLAIGLSFDALATDRQRGTLMMILVSPVAISELAWTRLLVRHSAVWLAVVLPSLTVLWLPGASLVERASRFSTWVVACGVYAAFWFALTGLCIARIRDARATAATLVGLWAAFTLGSPALAGATEALFPPPSRLAYLAEMRAAQGEANRDVDRLTEGYLMDHPDLTVGDEAVPAFYRGTFLANRAVRVRTAPILEAYEHSMAARRRLISTAQFLSPPLLIRRVLHVAAGADVQREHAFQAQARAALYVLSDALGPAIVARQRITTAELDALEPFVLEDRTTTQVVTAAAPLVFLAAVTLLLVGVANRSLQQQDSAPVPHGEENDANWVSSDGSTA